MATLRELRRRIRSIKNTAKITRAMKMVAAAKLRKAQAKLYQARPFNVKLRELVKRLSIYDEVKTHPFFNLRAEKRAEVVLITSDRGLCGGFNTNIIKVTTDFIRSFPEKAEVILTPIGRKGYNFFKRRNYYLRDSFYNKLEDFSWKDAEQLANFFIEQFLLKENSADAIYLVYYNFLSTASHKIKIEKVLPMPLIQDGEFWGIPEIWEPSSQEVLQKLLPWAITSNFYIAVMDSRASEFAARMTAMESATKNANELIDKLILTLNRARQTAITKEIIEIITGAEALK